MPPPILNRQIKNRFADATRSTASCIFAVSFSVACLSATDDDIAPPEAKPDEQEQTKTKQKSWLDQLHNGFAENIDGSARWVDGFFGERVSAEDTPGAYGRFKMRFQWQEYEGMSVRTRLRAELPLDNLSKRVRAVVGRGNSDDVIEDRSKYDDLLSSGDGDDWLAGLGYTPPWSRSKRVNIGAGVKLDIPLDPYVRASYQFQHKYDEKSLIRARQTVFWERQDGFGTSTTLDLERSLSDNQLLRWSSWGKLSEVSRGVIYDSRLMLYNKLSAKRALLFTLGVEGESDSPVPVHQYGGYVTYRQQVFREWLFGELIFGVSQYQDEDWPKRRTSLVVGFGFEMAFWNGEYQSDSTQVGSPNRFASF